MRACRDGYMLDWVASGVGLAVGARRRGGEGGEAAYRGLYTVRVTCGVCAILVRSSLSRDPVQNRFRDLVEISKFLFGEAKSLEISFAPGRPQISKRISRDPWIRQLMSSVYGFVRGPAVDTLALSLTPV